MKMTLSLGLCSVIILSLAGCFGGASVKTEKTLTGICFDLNKVRIRTQTDRTQLTTYCECQGKIQAKECGSACDTDAGFSKYEEAAFHLSDNEIKEKCLKEAQAATQANQKN